MKSFPSLLIAICTLLLTSVLNVTAQTPWQQKVDPVLFQQLSRSADVEMVIMLQAQLTLDTEALPSKIAKGQYVYEQLRRHADQTQNSLRRYLDGQNIPHKTFWVGNFITLRGGLNLVEQLALRDDVRRIHANDLIYNAPLPTDEIEHTTSPSAIPWGITNTKADQVWSTLGITGTGVIIGGQDTGYIWDHEALKTHYRGWDGSSADHNYNWYDAIHGDVDTVVGNPCGFSSPVPCDDHGHGTHTMGTMVGDNGAGEQIGMAPGAKWIACRNMESGWGTLTTYSECFQWFIAPTDVAGNNPDPSKAPHVINNSWGCPPAEGCNTSNFATMEMVVNNVRAAGIVVVVSAGNSGSSCSSINSPAAIYDGSFTVGAIDSAGNIASFSSRGPVTVDGGNRPKPDISAPGVAVRSAWKPSGYVSLQGTSMAAPHVAGLVALMLSANPALSGRVDDIETIITNTAISTATTQNCGESDQTTMPASYNYSYGFGRIDALAAVEAAQNFIVPTSVVVSQNTSLSSAWGLGMICLLVIILCLLTLRYRRFA